MRCRKAYKRMSAYLDGELSAGERTGVEVHLAHCRACAAEYQSLREVRRLLSGTERFVAPTGFSRRVMARTEPAPRSFPAPFFVRFAEVAVLLLVIGIGVVLGRFVTPPPGTPVPGSEAVAALSLDLFDPAPAGSLGRVYLAMMETGHAQ